VWCRCYDARKRESGEAGPLWQRYNSSRIWLMRFRGDEQRGPSREEKDLLFDGEDASALWNIPRFYMGDAMPNTKEAAESILGRNEAYEAAMKGEWYGGFGACLIGIHPSGAGAIDDVKRMTRKEIAEFVPSPDMGSVSLGRRHSLAYVCTRHGWRTYLGWPALRLYLSILGDPSPYGEPLEWAHSACPLQQQETFLTVVHSLSHKRSATETPIVVELDQFLSQLNKEFDSQDVMHGIVPQGLDPHAPPSEPDPVRAKIYWVRPSDTTPPQTFPMVYRVRLMTTANVGAFVDGERVKGY